jgi:SNF2 family DNA or RNA helicase
VLQAGKKELIDDLIKIDSNAVKSLSKDDLLNLLD